MEELQARRLRRCDRLVATGHAPSPEVADQEGSREFQGRLAYLFGPRRVDSGAQAHTADVTGAFLQVARPPPDLAAARRRLRAVVKQRLRELWGILLRRILNEGRIDDLAEACVLHALLRQARAARAPRESQGEQNREPVESPASSSQALYRAHSPSPPPPTAPPLTPTRSRRGVQAASTCAQRIGSLAWGVTRASASVFGLLLRHLLADRRTYTLAQGFLRYAQQTGQLGAYAALLNVIYQNLDRAGDLVEFYHSLTGQQ